MNTKTDFKWEEFQTQMAIDLDRFLNNLINLIGSNKDILPINEQIQSEKTSLFLTIINGIQARLLSPENIPSGPFFIFINDHFYCFENGDLKVATLDDLANLAIYMSNKLKR